MVFLMLATLADSKQGVSRSLSRSRYAWLLVSILRPFRILSLDSHLSALRKQLTEGLSFSRWKLLSRLMLWKVSILFLAVLVVVLSKIDRVLISCSYLCSISLILLISSFLELLKSASRRRSLSACSFINFFCCEKSLAIDLLFDFYRSISLFLLRQIYLCLAFISRHSFSKFLARCCSCCRNDSNYTNYNSKFLMQTFKLLFYFLNSPASSPTALLLDTSFCSSLVRVATRRATSSLRSSFSRSAALSLFWRKSANLACFRKSSSCLSLPSSSLAMYLAITSCSRDWYSSSSRAQCSSNWSRLSCCRSSPSTTYPCRTDTCSHNRAFSPSNRWTSLRRATIVSIPFSTAALSSVSSQFNFLISFLRDFSWPSAISRMTVISSWWKRCRQSLSSVCR